MAEIALSAAGWVASPILTRLLKEGFSYLGDAGINDRLENLEITILSQFQLVIEAIERSYEHTDKLKLWLRKLKYAMYEAEEMLDLYQYQLLEEGVHLFSHPLLRPFVNLERRLFTLPLQKNKLRESLIKLERIAAQAKTFREITRLQIGSSTTNDTISRGRSPVTDSIPLPQIFGRDEERDEIINRYLLDPYEAFESEESRSYSVVTVEGIGGSGKTTLAQLVYNDQRVWKNFDIRMWVCMSRKLDIFRLTMEMIESASISEEYSHIESLVALQRVFFDLIKSKKVLLVLDDVWCYKSENEAEWEQLLAPLTSAERGSRILVTTRPENMPNMPEVLHSKNIIKLKDLEEGELIKLFMHYAFAGVELSELPLREDLEMIGKQIVQKLGRSPLAAKVMGAQLSKRLEINFWRATLEQDNLNDIKRALIWSYQRLEAPLQRCFSYCSLFPKDHRFQAKEMIHLWVAEGFIIPSNDSTRLEDIANYYFAELVSGSFLQLFKQYGDTRYYAMHDLFHDLAEQISEEDCFRIEGYQVEYIPRTIRRLYVSGESMSRVSMSFHKLGNLRTLVISETANISDSDLRRVLEKFKKLRVLKLSVWKIKSLPESIGDLKHLRYLDLHWSCVSELPALLGKLYHLQVLKLPHAVKSLPRSMQNLFNLRHLESDHNYVLSTIPSIGRLTSLQGLEYFEVKKESGYDIGQLQNLNELRGTLTISGLENAEGRDNAIGGNLKVKKHLESLCLQWCNDNESECNSDFHLEVLEGLQPHPDLTKMEIRGCKSLKCPSWLIYRENLRSLSFGNSSFEALPTISELFPHCQELEIRSLPNLKMFPLLSGSLEKLVINSCPLLIFVSEEDLQRSDRIKRSIMTAVQSSQLKKKLEEIGDIRERVVRDCLDVKKLIESEKIDIPEDFQKIVATLQSEQMPMQVNYLHLWEAYFCCQELRLEAVFARRENSELMLPSVLQHLEITSCNITDGALSLCLRRLSSIKSLELNGIRTITTVPTDHLMELSSLEIVDCHCLKSLPGLPGLLFLKTLSISYCPCLELEMTEDGQVILPPSLRTVKVRT